MTLGRLGLPAARDILCDRMSQVHYAKSEGVSLAYCVAGEGQTTLLHVPGALSNFSNENAAPPMARYFERIARFCRVIRFDKRGTGLSDRTERGLSIAEQVPDVEAVRRATGAERVALYGLSQGAAVAILYTLAFPERVTHLVLVEGICCDAQDPEQPLSSDNQLVDWEEFFADLERDFEAFSRHIGQIMFARQFEEDGSWTEMLRATASPASFASLWRGIVGLDLRSRLGEIAVPTLVLHATGDRHHPVAHGRYCAARIPGARYVELNSELHVPYMDEAIADQMLVAIEEFLTGSVQHAAERRFATLLFTDIVDSTGQQKRRGDRAWRSVLEVHEVDTRRLVEQFRGAVIEIQGDGALAAFSTASEALRAARALTAAARERGIHIRAGAHAGEVYEAGGRLFGICISVAARVASRASADEVLTTPLIQGLVEGSGFSFSDAGEFDLKGVGTRRLLRLASGASSGKCC